MVIKSCVHAGRLSIQTNRESCVQSILLAKAKATGGAENNALVAPDSDQGSRQCTNYGVRTNHMAPVEAPSKYVVHRS